MKIHAVFGVWLVDLGCPAAWQGERDSNLACASELEASLVKRPRSVVNTESELGSRGE